MLYLFRVSQHAKFAYWVCPCDVCIVSRSPLTMTRCKCLASANRIQSACPCGFVINVASTYVYKVAQHAKLRFWAAYSICTNPGIFVFDCGVQNWACHPIDQQQSHFACGLCYNVYSYRKRCLSQRDPVPDLLMSPPASRDGTVAMCIETLLTILRGPYWEASKRIRSPMGIPICN